MDQVINRVINRIGLWLLVLLWLVPGCSAGMIVPSTAIPPETVGEAGSAAVAVQPTAASKPTAFTLTELTFAGNGKTFLDHIARTIQATGTPIDHRFITIPIPENGDIDREPDRELDTLWQGELVAFETQSLVFLQAAYRGGTQGLQIEVPTGTTVADVTALLNSDGLPLRAAAMVSSGSPTIEFVRARLISTSGTGASDTGASIGVTLWNFDVTVRYPDSGWADYADGWQVETADGEILGTRILLHPHENEQPFTRSLGNVAIPETVQMVLLRAHDLVNGYAADAVAVPLAEAVEGDGYVVVR